MALTYGELSATTQKFYVPRLVDNIFNSNVLLQRWRKKDQYKAESGGTSIMQPLMYATTTSSGWYSGTDTLLTTANDQITSAEFTRASIYANITIAHTDELQNGGDSQIIDFVKSKVQAAEMTLADSMGTAMFNAGTDTKAIVGLRLAVDSAGTYGGISRTTSTWHAAQEDSTSTTLSMSLMQGIFGDCTVGNDKPTVIVTTQDLYDIYMGMLTPMQRFQDEDTAKGGFTNIMFNGVPVVVDSHCTAAHMFFLNEKYFTLFYNTKDNFRFEPFIKPVDQAVACAKVFWSGQMVTSNCRMQGKLAAITG
jgi:hypothetical protein